MERRTRRRNPGEPKHLYRHGGPRFGDLRAQIILHHAHPARLGLHDDHVAATQRAVLDQDCRHRPTALVEPSIKNNAPGAALGTGLEFHDLGLEADHLQQVLDALTGLRGYVDADHIAAKFFGHEIVLGQPLQGLRRVRV